MERGPNQPRFDRHEVISRNHRLSQLWFMEAARIDMLAQVGEPVDDSIKDTVVALRLLRFRTSASCSGHLESLEERGPYVDISNGTGRRHAEAYWQVDLRDDQRGQIADNAAADNVMNALRLDHMVRRFYGRHAAGQDDARLQLEVLYEPQAPVQGGVRLWSAATAEAERRQRPMTPNELLASQAEMHLFTDFMVDILDRNPRL